LSSGFLVLYSDDWLESLISAVIATGGSIGPVSFRQAALIPFRQHGSTIRPICHQLTVKSSRTRRDDSPRRKRSLDHHKGSSRDSINGIELDCGFRQHSLHVDRYLLSDLSVAGMNVVRTRDESIHNDQSDWVH
jgi:hypothetical protein